MYCCRMSIHFIVKFCVIVTVMCKNGKFQFYCKKRLSLLSFVLFIKIYVNKYDKMIQYNTVIPNLKGSTVLPQFRDSFGLKKAKIKKNSGLYISFSLSTRFCLNIFGLTVLYFVLTKKEIFYLSKSSLKTQRVVQLDFL